MPIYIPKIKVRYQSIDEILMINEYWNLIDREPFLVIITWEPNLSQVCSFCRMLKDQKNFRFTTIPDKTKDFIFLKSPKNLVFWPFWPFWRYFFQKNSALSHITKYRPLTPYYVSEKTNEFILRKLTARQGDRQTIGWTNRLKDKPSFIGPFWPCPGV